MRAMVLALAMFHATFFRAKAPMMTSFEEFVGALFKDIQPLSNFEIIRICKKLKISNFKGCFMRDEIRSFCGSDECFILNTDESSSSGTHWVAVNIAGACDAYGAGACEATVLTVLHITLTHLASSRPKKSNDIVRNLDFTTHLNFKNQTK